jgi:glucosylglycerate synthase
MLDAGVKQDREEHIATAGDADIVLGILSYNNASMIGSVTRDAQESLTCCFSQHRSVLVHADGGSKDGTPESALASVVNKHDFVQIAYPVHPAQKISPGYYGVPGKASAVQAILGVARELNAAACAIVDSTASVPACDLIEGLVRPVMEEGVDFAAPSYLRHKYDAPILSGIVYPLTSTLYGKRLHQPIGGDYAFSGKLVAYLARQMPAEGDATSSGADAWITVEALCGGFRLAQAFLGSRVVRQQEPAPEVSTILSQALGAVFSEMDRSAAIWQRIRGSQLVPAFGSPLAPLADPPPVDPNPMLQSFRLGFRNLIDIYGLVLPPATLVELKRMSFQTADTFHFDDVLWARIIYDFALAWRTRIMDRVHLLGALTPLYLGWVASWVRAVRDDGPNEAQERIETLVTAYETEKGYLISRWRWPDRFNP